MQYFQLTPVIQRRLTAVMAVVISLVVATSLPVKAETIHQGLIGAAQDLRRSINTTIDSTIAAIEQNAKDMTTLNNELTADKAQMSQTILQTREDINKFLETAGAIKNDAEKLVSQGINILGKQLQLAGANALQQAVDAVSGVVDTGRAIIDGAKKLAEQGAQQLNNLLKNAVQFTKEQVTNISNFISQQIDNAKSIVKEVSKQVEAGVAIISSGVQAVGAAAGQVVQQAVATVTNFVDTGKAVVEDAVKQVATGAEMLVNKVASDLETMKNAVQIKADETGVGIKIDLGNGIVTYAGISIPPEVAAQIKEAGQKTVAALTAIQKAIQDATDPAVIKARAQEAVKRINEAAIANVYAKTAKAVSSQIKVTDNLQVSANALQVQINKLQQCIKNSSTDAECATLRTDLNSADQGVSLQESIAKTRVNIDTVRAFLSASVNLVSLLKDGNYRGTIESLTSMTTMMSSISTLSGGLRNDLKNISNAVNVEQSTDQCQAEKPCYRPAQ